MKLHLKIKNLLFILFFTSTFVSPSYAQVPGLTEAIVGGLVGGLAAQSASRVKEHKGAAWSQDIYRSHLTDHLKKTPRGVQIEADQRGFSVSAKTIIWVGESAFMISPRPVKAVWFSPQGKYIETRVVRFKSKIYKTVLPNKKDFFSDHQGRWQVRIFTATGQEVDRQNFYIGHADMQEESKEVTEVQDSLNLASEDAVVIFSKREVIVHDQYGSLERWTKRMMVLSDRGKEFVEVFMPVVSGINHVNVNYAYTIKPDGQVVDAKEYGIQTFAKSYPDYSAFKFFSMTLSSLQKGCIVEYQIVISTPVPKAAGMFCDYYAPQYQLPVIKSSYSLNIPKSMHFKYLQLNTKVDVQENASGEDRKTYQFSAGSLASIKPEPAMPSPREVIGEVIITTAKSWDDIAQWWHRLIKDKSQVTPDIQARVDELIKDAVDNQEKIHRIYTDVSENVRYVGLNFGSNVYEPANAADVFRNKYGDCKDQSMLLLAMFKAAGIKAHTALARSGFDSMVQKDLPTLNEFNHVIVVAEDENREYFLDPTLKKYAFEVLSPRMEDRYVMHIKQGTATFEFLPLSRAENNLTSSFINLKLDSKLNISGEIKIQWHGQENGDIRQYLYQLNSSKQKEEFVDGVLKGVYPYALRDSYEFDAEEDVDSPLTVKITFHMDNWLLDVGDGDFLFHMYGGEVKVPDFVAKNRIYPVKLKSLNKQVVHVQVKLPDQFDVELPQPFDLFNNYIANHVRYTYKDHLLQLDQELKTLKTDIPVDQIVLIRDAWEKIAQSNRKGVLLKPKRLVLPLPTSIKPLEQSKSPVNNTSDEKENQRKAMGLARLKAKTLGYLVDKISMEFCEDNFESKFVNQPLQPFIQRSLKIKRLYAIHLEPFDSSKKGLIVFIDKKELFIVDILVLK